MISGRSLLLCVRIVKTSRPQTRVTWDEEEVSSDDNEIVEVKLLMALAEANDVISKEGAINGKWVKISHEKVNQYIIEQISSQKKRILGVDQLTKDPSSSGQKDLVFVKSLADDTKVSIPGVERPWLSEAECFIMPNHDTADESSVYSTPLHPLKKLDDVEPISGPKTIKSILSSSTSKVNSAPAGKLKSVKIEDDPPLAICDIRKPIWYLDSGCSRHMTGVKSYLHKYMEQPGPKVFPRPSQSSTQENIKLKKPITSHLMKDLMLQLTTSTLLKMKDIHLMNIFILLSLLKAPQDRWSREKHIELVNIIGNPVAGMLTRSMAKELGAASAHECLFVYFLSEEEPKKVFEAL
ncbi:hypothetical protein Tco_0677074 [Tanacetum coccineum]